MKKIMIVFSFCFFLFSNSVFAQRVITEIRNYQSEQRLFALNNQYRVRQGLPPFLRGNALGDSLALTACRQTAKKIMNFQKEVEEQFNFFLKNNNYNFGDAIDKLIASEQKRYEFYSSILEKNKKIIVDGLEYYTKYPNQKKYNIYIASLVSYVACDFYEKFEIGHINFSQREERMKKNGFPVVGENAMLSPLKKFTGEDLLRGYQNSPGHNKNLLMYFPNVYSYYVSIITIKINEYSYNVMFIYAK